jgi:hypothetical protein
MNKNAKKMDQFPCPPQRGRERSHPVDESTYNLVYFPYIIEIIKI